ncbi:MAG: terminase gpA endonuclease subunit [Thermodesulfobacteriota bacterium]
MDHLGLTIPKQEWMRVGPRKEALDREVYAYAAAVRVGLDKVSWESWGA